MCFLHVLLCSWNFAQIRTLIIQKLWTYISVLWKKKCCSSKICVTTHINLILFWRFHKDLMCTKVRVLENNGNVLTVQSTAVTYHVYHLIVDLAHPKFPPRCVLWVEKSFLQRTILLWHLLGSTGEFRLVLGWHCWHVCNSTNFNPKPSLTNLGILGLSCSSRAFLYPLPNNVAAQE